MKIQIGKLVLGLAAALLMGTNVALCADTTPPAQATPGTAPAMDTKTQENNPGGPTTQATAHPKEGTKKKKHKTHAPADAGTNQSGDTATKTPQQDMPPSTPTGTADQTGTSSH